MSTRDGKGAAPEARLESRVAHQGGIIDLALAGVAEARDREALQKLIERVHAQAGEVKASEVRVDLKALRFMTSACFKDFVGWLGKVRELPTERRYKIRFLSNPSIRWQRASLAALSSFAVDLVTVE